MRGYAFGPALSRDGRVLAFTKPDTPGIWIVGTHGGSPRRVTFGPDSRPDWSPDGKALAFLRSKGDSARVLVVKRLRGTGRELAWGDFRGFKWSLDGRWIAYTAKGLWVVRPSGALRHRLTRFAGDFAWSPDSKRLAVMTRDDVAVIGLDGRWKRLGLDSRRFRPSKQGLSGLYMSGLAWSPDGRRLALGGNDYQVWVVGSGGRGLHQVAGAGHNGLVGWTRLAPVLPPAGPVPPTERLLGAHTLALRAQVTSIAADGRRVAFIADSTPTDCGHVAVWAPARKSIRRFSPPSPCLGVSLREGLYPVALARTRAAWLHTAGGNDLEQYVVTATLARPANVEVESAGPGGDASYGTFVGNLAGDGSLLAFTIEHRCSAYTLGEDACSPGFGHGDVTAATVYRIGSGSCPSSRGKSRACTPIAKADGELDLLAVNAGRIVLGTETGVRLLTAGGRVLRDFAVPAKAAALSASRLALETADGIAVYDTSSGGLTARFPALRGLRDLDGDILLAGSGKTVTLRRLGGGRTLTLAPGGGRVLADLEPPGLYYSYAARAGGSRLVYVPRAKLIGELGGSA